MRALRRLFSGVLFLLLAFSGCGETNVAQLETHIVIDKQVMSFVQTFEVFALQMATTGGQPVRCQDIPKTYKINDGNLKWCFSDQRQAQCAAAVRWGRQQNEAELGVNVPYGVPLIFVRSRHRRWNKREPCGGAGLRRSTGLRRGSKRPGGDRRDRHDRPVLHAAGRLRAQSAHDVSRRREPTGWLLRANQLQLERRLSTRLCLRDRLARGRHLRPARASLRPTAMERVHQRKSTPALDAKARRLPERLRVSRLEPKQQVLVPWKRDFCNEFRSK
jgi:hypothetical protein